MKFQTTLKFLLLQIQFFWKPVIVSNYIKISTVVDQSGKSTLILFQTTLKFLLLQINIIRDYARKFQTTLKFLLLQMTPAQQSEQTFQTTLKFLLLQILWGNCIFTVSNYIKISTVVDILSLVIILIVSNYIKISTVVDILTHSFLLRFQTTLKFLLLQIFRGKLCPSSFKLH